MSLPKRTLGKTGIEVSLLGFGCMRLPLRGEKHSDIDIPLATAMLRRAVDAGVNYVDTAYPYHSDNFTDPGQSEPFVAKALADGYRAKVAVATKLPLWLVESRADMDRILDSQLRRLDTPYIDMYLAHNINTGLWQKMVDLGLTDFFDAALKDGRIRHAGFSFHDRYPLFEEILNSYDWAMAQIQYNYMDVDHQAGTRGLRLAADRGVGVVVMEPLRGGFLVNHLPETARRILHDARPEWSLPEWALKWVWDQPEASTALSGMSTMEQVEDNLRIAAEAKVDALAESDREAVAGVRRFFRERLQVGCTACGYCLPCPQDVAIPKAFNFFNEYHFSDEEAPRRTVRMFYSGIMGKEKQADSCTSCGACLSKCPQHIDIPKEMARVAALFHPNQTTL